jgi:hypothetical protein
MQLLLTLVKANAFSSFFDSQCCQFFGTKGAVAVAEICFAVEVHNL